MSREPYRHVRGRRLEQPSCERVEEVKVGLKSCERESLHGGDGEAGSGRAEDAKIYRLNKIRLKCLRGTAQVEHFRDPVRGDVVWTCAGRDGG